MTRGRDGSGAEVSVNQLSGMQTDVLATSGRRMYLLKDKTYQIGNNDRCKALICH